MAKTIIIEGLYSRFCHPGLTARRQVRNSSGLSEGFRLPKAFGIAGMTTFEALIAPILIR
jgi:hypothetical protein